MTPFFIYGALTEAERLICHKLVEEGGPLGLDEEEIAATQIELGDVEDLVKCGIVKKAPLFQIAQELVADKEFIKIKEGLEEEGGYFGTDDESERLFICCFDMASEIVEGGDVEGNSTMQYQVARRDLYDFLGMLL